MDAATFDRLMVQHLVEPLAPLGFERWGKSLFYEHPDGMRAGVVRTEGRNIWPFRLTLAIGHARLRDFQDRVPAPRTTDLNQWPIKVAPSSATDLLKRRWRYRPHNRGLHGWPGDVFADETTADQLRQIRIALTATFPAVVDVLTPAVLRKQLVRRGEDAWCERRWIEDCDQLQR